MIPKPMSAGLDERMSETRHNDDLDRIDGSSVIAWLIYTAAGTMVGSVPMTFYYGFIEAFNSPPQPVYGAGDFLQLMSEEMTASLMPMINAMIFAGAISALVVVAARFGVRLHALIVILLGTLGGLAAAFILFPPDVLVQAVGGATGFIAGCGMVLARRILIRGG
jgi:hypothetical protein